MVLVGPPRTRQILEKSLGGEDAAGADLALWPAATKILKELGVGSTEPADGDEFVDLSDFWGRKTYPVQSVRICKVASTKSSPEDALQRAATAPAAPDGASSTFAGTAAAETVLTKVDMDAVVEGEGEPFVLVRRQAVISALLPLVDKASVRRGVRLLRAEQSSPPGEPTAAAHIAQAGSDDRGGDGSGSAERVSCRVLVGADGIHSVCRLEVSAAAAALSNLRQEDGGGATSASFPRDHPVAATAVRAALARDGGEVCYRGVVDLRDGSPAAKAGLRAMFEEDEKRRPNSMAVVYGDRIRYSWGFIDGARETGYWFVKQLTDKKHSSRGDGEGGKEDAKQLSEGWPEPLKTLAEITGEECSYAHRIQDRPPLDRYEIAGFVSAWELQVRKCWSTLDSTQTSHLQCVLDAYHNLSMPHHIVLRLAEARYCQTISPRELCLFLGKPGKGFDSFLFAHPPLLLQLPSPLAFQTAYLASHKALAGGFTLLADRKLD